MGHGDNHSVVCSLPSQALVEVIVKSKGAKRVYGGQKDGMNLVFVSKAISVLVDVGGVF